MYVCVCHILFSLQVAWLSVKNWSTQGHCWLFLMRPRSWFQFPFGQLALLSASFSSQRLVPNHHIQDVSHGMGGWRGKGRLSGLVHNCSQAYGQPEASGNVSYDLSSGCSLSSCEPLLNFLWVGSLQKSVLGSILLTSRLDYFSIHLLYPRVDSWDPIHTISFGLWKVLHLWFLTFSALESVAKESANKS